MAIQLLYHRHVAISQPWVCTLRVPDCHFSTLVRGVWHQQFDMLPYCHFSTMGTRQPRGMAILPRGRHPKCVEDVVICVLGVCMWLDVAYRQAANSVTALRCPH